MHQGNERNNSQDLLSEKSNTEPFTQDFSTPIVSPIVQDTAKEAKDLEEVSKLKEKTDVQG